MSLRRTVEKSEQLTINDLNSFNIGDYVVHIDHGVGVFGGLVKMYDDKGRAKMDIALCKGKKEFDKRQTLKEKEDRREMDRAMKAY